MAGLMAPRASYSRTAPVFEVLARMPDREGALPSVVSGLEPAALVAVCARHGVSAFVADALSGVSFPGRARLVADARATVAASQKLKRLTLSVVDALGAVGVTPVMLKGVVLATRLYPANPLARPASDVDVLVEPGQVEVVAGALENLSLRRFVDDSLGDPFEDHHHVAFVGPPGLVEVHFRLISTLGRGLFDDEAIRRRAIESVFEGRRVLLLSAEDEFLYLAVHAANHAFLRVSWLLDLKQYLALHPSLDFVAMGERARDAGFAQAVAVTLDLIERLLDVELPQAARAAFPARRRRGFVDSFLFSAVRVENASWSADRLGSFALRLWLVDSPGRGLRHLVDGVARTARHVLSSH